MNNYEAQIRDRLDDTGARYTAGRKVVVAALDSGNGPRSAAELHEDLSRKIPLSTIYRTLAVLHEAGVVEPHHGQGGVIRYELAEWLKGHHHHLVCIDCGAVEDVELSPGLEDDLERVVTRLSGKASFSAVGHSLEIDGRCARCA